MEKPEKTCYACPQIPKHSKMAKVAGYLPLLAKA